MQYQHRYSNGGGIPVSLTENQTKVLKALNINSQYWGLVNKDIAASIDLLYVVQDVYTKSIESIKKQQLALTISEMAKLLIAEFNKLSGMVQVTTRQISHTPTQPPAPQPPKKTDPCEKWKDEDLTMEELKEALKLFKELAQDGDEDAKEEVKSIKERIKCLKSKNP